MDPLTEIGIKHDTDKATFHNFTSFYEQHFRTRRYDEMTILELGILNGKSLLTLQEYFPNATIHAIDINK
jgi:methylase of polypeptide subunit release factors